MKDDAVFIFAMTAVFLLGALAVLPALGMEMFIDTIIEHKPAVFFGVVAEEFLKLFGVVLMIITLKPTAKQYVLLGMAAGLGYGLSENLMVSMPPISQNYHATMVFRSFYTMPLHILSSTIMAFALTRGRQTAAIICGTAIFIHFAFNLRVM